MEPQSQRFKSFLKTEPDDAVRKVWKQANIEMSGLSTNGKYRLVEGATHMSLAYRQKDAQVYTEWILSILDAVRRVSARSDQIEPGWRRSGTSFPARFTGLYLTNRRYPPQR